MSEQQRDQQRQFLQELHHLVDAEAEAQQQALHKLYQLPLQRRIAKGRAIDRVTLTRKSDGQLFAHTPHNLSVFREGDIIQVGRGNPLMDPHRQAGIEKETERGFLLHLFHGQIDLHREDPENWVLDESLLDLSEWYRKALNTAGETEVGRERVLPLLMGQQQPTVDPDRYEKALNQAEAAGFNWSQVQAYAESYATPSAYLIQGPPGTGKTRVLAQLAGQLAREGERVLITAFTHRAINHALNTLARHHPDCTVVKIGPRAGGADLNVKSYENFSACPLRRSSAGYVVGATCFATQTNRLRDVSFDTVIFDEASQITLPLAIMGMLSAQRSIFVGDQKQLPPVLTCRQGFNLPGDSVFGHLTGRGFDSMLTVSYRLNAELCAWPSHQFYQGALSPANDTPPTEPSTVFVPIDHHGCTVVAPREVEAVVRLVTELTQAGIAPEDIGVVAPFRAQGRAIRRTLSQTNPAWRVIVADTVERMQGQEREVIIFSLVSSDCGFLENIAAFYFQPERLNVSITRACRKLFVVGSLASLSLEPENEPLKTWHGLFVDFLNAIRDA